MESSIDIVYILGTGSQWGDNEIKYSLRSVEKYLKGYRNIYLIGEKPEWISDEIKYYSFKEDPRQARERRIMEKIKFACQIPELSENFLFFNDDFFLIREMHANVPYYHNGPIEETLKRRLIKDEYYRALINTQKESPGNHFDIHYPIVYNKSLFVQVMDYHDWSKRAGYTVKSLYCNTLKIEGEFMNDCKINRKLTRNRIIESIEHRNLFSIGDKSLNIFMKEFLNELYPNPCKYEKELDFKD